MRLARSTYKKKASERARLDKTPAGKFLPVSIVNSATFRHPACVVPVVMHAIAKIVDFASAGSVEDLGFKFRAHVRWAAQGRDHRVYGPIRWTRTEADKDLNMMRAAAHGMQANVGYEEIAATAARLKLAAARLRNKGTVQDHGESFRALIQWNDEGVKRHLQGPWRSSRERAEGDLGSIWQKGALGIHG